MVFIIIIPFLNGYFIGGIPHFQIYPDGIKNSHMGGWVYMGGLWMLPMVYPHDIIWCCSNMIDFNGFPCGHMSNSLDTVWVNYNELTTSSLEIIVSKGNHPQMALIQVSELL